MRGCSDAASVIHTFCRDTIGQTQAVAVPNQQLDLHRKTNVVHYDRSNVWRFTEHHNTPSHAPGLSLELMLHRGTVCYHPHHRKKFEPSRMQGSTHTRGLIISMAVPLSASHPAGPNGAICLHAHWNWLSTVSVLRRSFQHKPEIPHDSGSTLPGFSYDREKQV
jgi:hypothetical protein